MDGDAILGCILLATSLGLMIAMVWWSRRTIDRIARRGPASARQTMKDLRSGR